MTELPTPFYQDSSCTLFCADCRDILPLLPKADLILTSPPYDNLREYTGRENDIEGIIAAVGRSVQPGGVIVWISGDQTINGGESGSSFRQALQFMAMGLNLHDTMIYMKSGPSYPAQNKYYQVFEYMFVLSNGKTKTFNPIKDRENRWWGDKWSKVRTRRKKDGTLTKTTWTGEEGEKFGTRFNIWQYAVGAGNHGDEFSYLHPASFPEDLAGDNIKSWSNEGDLVIDPMCGGGTTLKMARLLGRRCIGVEVEEKYCAVCVKRLSQMVLI